VDLTTSDSSIVKLLIPTSPAVLQRQAAAAQARPDGADAIGFNTIDVHIACVRARLARSDARIETFRGSGYRLVAT
jgi:DNA-binding response OmpR family regulator